MNIYTTTMDCVSRNDWFIKLIRSKCAWTLEVLSLKETHCLSFFFLLLLQRAHDHGNFYMELGLAYSCKGSVSYHHGGEYGSVQSDVMLVWAESPTSCRQPGVHWDTGRYPEHRKLQSLPHNDSLPLTRSYHLQQNTSPHSGTPCEWT